MRAFLLLLLLLCSSATLAQTPGQNSIPQGPGTLIADRIEITPGGVLVATGNVAIWQGDVSLIAAAVSYDATNDVLTISGPITLNDGNGGVILADQAQLDRSLRRGIMQGARLILNQEVQLASAQISRVNGRYTQALKVAATSCQVCKGQTPLWQIRAARVVHDTLERQLYFEQAQLRVFDVPILYFPQVRLPDPSLDRATGFMVPRVKNSSVLGLGLKIPYFIKIGDHKDLTLTPYMSSSTKTLEFRYRQAIRFGEFSLTGALSNDDILNGQTRAYVFGTGNFDLPRSYSLDMELQAVKDPTYLFDYGYASTDRLKSDISLTRASRDKNVELSFSTYKSLRANDDNATLPTVVSEGILQQRFSPSGLGGEIDYALSYLGSYRYSDLNIDGPDLDGEVDGFDVARLSLSAGWRGSNTFENGMIGEVTTQVAADQYVIRQHSGFPNTVSRLTGSASIGLRWPMVRHSQGRTDVIEPQVQLTWSGSNGASVPNQDSTRVEFDEGNLFSTNRTPGHDFQELGTRVNIGFRGTSTYAEGQRIAWEVGRIIRATNPQSFSSSSGLSGTSSDWLLSTHVAMPNGLQLIARGLVADTGSVRKAETRVNWQTQKSTVDATYMWLNADPAENRPTSVSELALAWRYQVADYWAVSTDLRYDFGVKELAFAGLGLTYENECASIGLSLSRRFTTSTTFQPTTDFGLTVSFTGYGTGQSAKKISRNCGA